jgi:hypothetical protein
MRCVRQTSICRGGTLLENVKWVFPNTGTTTSDIMHIFKDWPIVFPAAQDKVRASGWNVVVTDSSPVPLPQTLDCLCGDCMRPLSSCITPARLGAAATSQMFQATRLHFGPSSASALRSEALALLS